MDNQEQNSLIPPNPNANPDGVQPPNVPGKSVSSAVVTPTAPDVPAESTEPEPKTSDTGSEGAGGTLEDVIKKINDCENVLVALSADPSVDEMAAALGLTLVLNEDGKHATAIYSGKTPNVIEFLKPEETFEANTNSLQDFIIALNKDKADHLRYKIDGDFVKVFITPYKTTLDESDLEFSRGDFNVDLVVAINVPAATDLDGALREYGRIMHDATSINITNDPSEKFGDLRWVDAEAGSISEMVTKLGLQISEEIGPDVATAFLTGLVAATDKFTNESTTPEVMKLAGKLMEAGADQQDVMKNVSQELKFLNRSDSEKAEETGDKTEISIDHDTVDKSSEKQEKEEAEIPEAETEKVSAPAEGTVPEEGAVSATNEAAPGGMPGMTIAGVQVTPTIEGFGNDGAAVTDQILNTLQQGAGEAGAVQPEGNVVQADASNGMNIPGGTDGLNGASAPTGVADNMTITPNSISADYGKMIDEALAEPLPGETGVVQPGSEMSAGGAIGAEGMPAPQGTPNLTTEDGLAGSKEFPPIIPTGGTLGYESPAVASATTAQGMTGVPEMNPAAMQAPDVAGITPNVAASPSVLPMPGQEIAPPPMAPMPDFATLPPVQGAAEVNPVVPSGPVQTPEQVGNVPQPQASPGAFQIPGM